MPENISGVTILVPKNWGEFQHYKRRNPPWIRLHQSLLDNYEFQCLPVASRALAPMLWLVASESGEPKTGAFDASPGKLCFRLRMSQNDFVSALNPLISSGFFSIASGVLATCERDAKPEAETEAETEAEFLCQEVDSVVDIYTGEVSCA